MASKKVANPSDVRSWAKDNLSSIEGLPDGYTVAKQGRLHPAIREAFNKAHKGSKYVVGVSQPKTVTVKATVVRNGRKVPLTKQVVVAEARKALRDAEFPNVGARGRLRPEALVAFATGDYAAPAPTESE